MEQTELWLLEVFFSPRLEVEDADPHWGLAGLFKTPAGMRRAVEDLAKSGKIQNDEFGVNHKFTLLKVRE